MLYHHGLGTKAFQKLNEEFPPKENDFAFDIKCESENAEVVAGDSGLFRSHFLKIGYL